MRTFDMTPYFRNSIGFDRLLSRLDHIARTGGDDSYPPYNIQKNGEETYRLTMAVAGFDQEHLELEVKDNQLTVTGHKDEAVVAEKQYLYRGIAERVFNRRFNLADYVKVEGANLENGLLNIDLKRELPEEMKPRSIEIVLNDKQVIESKAA